MEPIADQLHNARTERDIKSILNFANRTHAGSRQSGKLRRRFLRLARHRREEIRVTSKQAQERREQVWKLIVIDRQSYRDAGKQLGVSEHTVSQDMRRMMAQSNDPELSQKVIAHQHAIYEALIDKWLPVALDREPAGDSPETRLAFAEMSATATDKVARILADQARLHGLGQTNTKLGPSAAELGEQFGKRMADVMLQVANKGQNKEAVVEAELVTPQIEDKKNT